MIIDVCLEQCLPTYILDLKNPIVPQIKKSMSICSCLVELNTDAPAGIEERHIVLHFSAAQQLFLILLFIAICCHQEEFLRMSC